MKRRILIVNGHPDPSPHRFCAALCDAYAKGAEFAGREVRRLEVGRMQLPPIASAADFMQPAAADAAHAQQSILWADHLVFVFPLWLGACPAQFKAFCEQVFRYGFAIPKPGDGQMKGLLKGRSARIIVTMGMPAPIFRLAFRAAGVRAFDLGVLWLSGIAPRRRGLVGDVEASAERRSRWLEKVRRWGERGV